MLLRLIAIFNEQELELLLSGLPDINIDDLKANSEYHKYSVTSLQIVWYVYWWPIVKWANFVFQGSGELSEVLTRRTEPSSCSLSQDLARFHCR